jgi:hypothetical protein
MQGTDRPAAVATGGEVAPADVRPDRNGAITPASEDLLKEWS